jgi:hypothetical protein
MHGSNADQAALLTALGIAPRLSTDWLRQRDIEMSTLLFQTQSAIAWVRAAWLAHLEGAVLRGGRIAAARW